MTSIVFSDQHPPKKYTFKPDLYYMIGNLLFPSGMLDQSYVYLNAVQLHMDMCIVMECGLL